MCRGLVFTLLLLWQGMVVAEISDFPFQTEAEEERFESLASELRCLVCQNQSLADSNAGLAGDLREELYQQLQQGHSDSQIIDFMTARYGEFILYKPAFNGRTLLLWLSPLLLFVIALFSLIRFIRQARSEPGSEASADDLEKIRVLLEERTPKE